MTYARGWVTDSVNTRVRLKAELDRANQDNVLLREDMRIKDAGAGQSLEQTAKAFLVTASTVCRLESRQYETASRLEAVTGVLSVVAVRLLQLKTVARHEPERPAAEVVPKPWIKMLQALRKRPLRQPCTVRDFFRDLAKLGGFLGRKRDGEPGWITVWRGFEKLLPCLHGAQAFQ